jgi:hypothetical protein
MKTYRGNGGIVPPFLSSALDEGEWSDSRPGRFTSGEGAPCTHWRGGLVSLRAGLDDVEKNLALPGIEPGLSIPSLYPLSYSDSSSYKWEQKMVIVEGMVDSVLDCSPLPKNVPLDSSTAR